MLNKEKQKKLLQLARKSIEHYLYTREFYIPEEEDFADDELQLVVGVFVTLTEGGRLRGCIGNIEGVEPLYIAVARNAVNAGFYDPRFYPLEPSELDKIKIEISILSKPKKLEYSSQAELIQLLQENKPGIILKQGTRSATFLPQVWEQVANPEEFLSHLCLKAGLVESCWKDSNTEILYYTVESFEEE